MAVKSIAKFAASGFLLILAGFCFPQSETVVQKAPSKTADGKGAASAAPDAIFPAVAARVNGDPIPGRDLEELVRQELSSIGNPEWKNLRGEYRGELTLSNITLLINSKLIYQKAAASGFKAADAEVQSELQEIAKKYKSGAEMDAALARQKTDRASLERKVYENLTVSKYVEETINRQIVVLPEELEKYYSGHLEEFRHPEIVRTSHILIQAAADTPEQGAVARQRAEALLDRIKKGENFAKLAVENSSASSASRGGDMGFHTRESVPPEYADAAFSLPPGGVKLVRTQNGYHIVKVVDRRKEGLFGLEDIRPQLVEMLKDQKSREELNRLIGQLREKANIEILLSTRELLNP